MDYYLHAEASTLPGNPNTRAEATAQIWAPTLTYLKL